MKDFLFFHAIQQNLQSPVTGPTAQWAYKPEQTPSSSLLSSDKINVVIYLYIYIYPFFASAAKRQHWPALGSHQATKDKEREQKKRDKHSQSYLSGANKDELQQQKRPSESGDLHHVVPKGSRGGSAKSFSLGFAELEEPRRKQPHGLRFGYLVRPRSHSHQGLMYIHTMLYMGRCFNGRTLVGGATAHTWPIGRVSGRFNLCCEPLSTHKMYTSTNIFLIYLSI